MRNKEWFLKELQARLAVLEEAEQQDILAEYAQHIDLRVAGGLTEEEAIRDFGDLDQLVAEILGAYHVRPTYQQAGAKKRLPNPWPAIRRGAARVGGFFQRLGGGIAGGFRRAWSAVRSWPGRISARLKLNEDFFEAEAERAEEDLAETVRETEEMASEPAAEEAALNAEPAAEREEETVSETKKTAGGAVGRFFRRLGRGVWRLCRGTAWLAWNLFLLLCALPFGGLGLAALVCLGTLAVLLIQGYPLIGVTLCCLGGTACCVGILGLGSGLIWHRARPAVQTAGAVLEVEPVTGLIRETVAEVEREEEDLEDGE